MPLIQADSKGKKAQITVDLDRKTSVTLKKYLRFCRADTSKVVTGALRMLFEQDPDFGPWLEKREQRKEERLSEDRSATPPEPSTEIDT